ncbi:MAG: 4Fe-4S dicluster domain-containing protein [Fidelibacterota bacterium]|nr:MAG: 4Fe-4S dicluster domain-containing protein [Candidatus Neomarinimicrobiota bacterium]
MAKISGTVEFRTEECKGCELCIEACPQDCLAMSSDLNQKGYHYAVLSADTCTGCINCALVCPDAVITVYQEVRPTEKSKRPIAAVPAT